MSNHTHDIQRAFDTYAEDYRRELNKQLYSEPSPVLQYMKPVKITGPERPLRKIIADAYDEVMGTNKQEEDMNKDLDEIVNEASKDWLKAQAEVYIDEFHGYFNSVEWTNGDTVTWTAEYIGNTNTYHSVALFGTVGWFLTNHNGVRSTDELIKHLVKTKLDARVFTFSGDE